MRGAIPPLPNTLSCRGAQFKKSTGPTLSLINKQEQWGMDRTNRNTQTRPLVREDSPKRGLTRSWTYWLIDRSIEWLTHWLSDWSIDWMTDWLTDWLPVSCKVTWTQDSGHIVTRDKNRTSSDRSGFSLERTSHDDKKRNDLTINQNLVTIPKMGSTPRRTEWLIDWLIDWLTVCPSVLKWRGRQRTHLEISSTPSEDFITAEYRSWYRRSLVLDPMRRFILFATLYNIRIFTVIISIICFSSSYL